jgi:NAD(P)H-dependent FMN reductase
VTAKPRIAVIVGSTRATRFADKPAAWIFGLASERKDWEVELVDVRSFDLPLFNERASNLWVPSEDPHAVAWQQKLATFDGFIFVTAEYNRSVPGSLKNALDQAYKEWVHKPAAVVAYGSTGGSRAAEHLRSISIELQMVPVRSGVHIMGADLMKVHPMGENGPISAIEDHILPSAKAMLADLDWWVQATMAARAGDTQRAAA